MILHVHKEKLNNIRKVKVANNFMSKSTDRQWIFRTILSSWRLIKKIKHNQRNPDQYLAVLIVRRGNELSTHSRNWLINIFWHTNLVSQSTFPTYIKLSAPPTLLPPSPSSSVSTVLLPHQLPALPKLLQFCSAQKTFLPHQLFCSPPPKKKRFPRPTIFLIPYQFTRLVIKRFKYHNIWICFR